MGHEGHDHSHSHVSPPESPSAREHKHHAPTHVAAWVITCSDSRNRGSDDSGKAIQELLLAHGHTVSGTDLVRDSTDEIRAAIERGLTSGARAIVLTGGTGIGPRDQTVEVVSGLLENTLPGFGELFRLLSFQEIGTPAMLSRAVAGTCRGAIVFALPGSPNAVTLAMRRLILPELGHLVRELTRAS